MGFVNPGHYRAVAVVADEVEPPLRYVYTREHRSYKTGGCKTDEMTAGSKGRGGDIGVKGGKSGRTLFVANAFPGFTGGHLRPEDTEGFKLGLMEQWGRFGKICSVELGGAEKEKSPSRRRVALDPGQTIMPPSIYARIM